MLNILEIMKLLPHRYPMLLVDRILDYEDGKRIVGLDLCEVSPGASEWDANVGARLLYKMIGFALLTQ